MSKANKFNSQPSFLDPDILRLPALRMRQGRDRILYAFAVDGKVVEDFATVSRVGRDDNRKIVGYQRPEMLSHIAEIRSYLESDNPMLPNAVVIAFDPSVRFEPHSGAISSSEGPSVSGELIIPIPTIPGVRKPGWIVDGQQRLAAIRESMIEGFTVWVVGFVASSDSEQREQFILVNNTRPLPKGLVYELLPSTESHLPTVLRKRRFPVALLDRLNLDDDSPLKGRIKTPTMPDGLIKDNSLIKMIENSLTDGVLYRLREGDEDLNKIEDMLRILKAFWKAVSITFAGAWGKKPKESRLLHGAGVITLGFIMDAISDRVRDVGLPDENQFRIDMEILRPICRWTEGHWEFGSGIVRKWNEVQNTPKDIQMLVNYLLAQYKARVWNAGR